MDSDRPIITPLAATIDTFRKNVNKLWTDVGDKRALTTADSSTIVGAINELDTDVGHRADLETDHDSNLVLSINELNQRLDSINTMELNSPSVHVAGDGTITGDLTVNTNLQVDGNTVLGDAGTDTLTINAGVNTDILPSGGRDLGSSSNKWAEVHAVSILGDNATLGTLQVSDLTEGRITYAGASGDLTDDDDLTFARINSVSTLTVDGNIEVTGNIGGANIGRLNTLIAPDTTLTGFTTVNPATVTGALNELKLDVIGIEGRESDLASTVVGDTSTLLTDDRSTLVAAINSNKGLIDSAEAVSGPLGSLNTSQFLPPEPVTGSGTEADPYIISTYGTAFSIHDLLLSDPPSANRGEHVWFAVRDVVPGAYTFVLESTPTGRDYDTRAQARSGNTTQASDEEIVATTPHTLNVTATTTTDQVRFSVQDYSTSTESDFTVTITIASDNGRDNLVSAINSVNFVARNAATITSRLSVNDRGGDGSLAYDAATGTFTYTGPSAGEVRAKFSAGTGIDISSGGTIAGEDASTSSKGIARFNSASFAVSSGAVSIKDSGIVEDMIGADAVTVDKIHHYGADDVLNFSASGVPQASKIRTENISDRAVTLAKMANMNTPDRVLGRTSQGTTVSEVQVNTGMLRNLGVTTGKLATGAVTTGKIANLAVTSAKIDSDAVGTVHLADGAVTRAKLADMSTADRVLGRTSQGAGVGEVQINTGMLATGAVTTGKIANLGVTTGKIANQAVTTAKLDSDAVTTEKILNGAVTTEKILDAAVTQAKVAADVRQVPSGGTTGQLLRRTSSGYGWATGLPKTLIGTWERSNPPAGQTVTASTTFSLTPANMYSGGIINYWRIDNDRLSENTIRTTGVVWFGEFTDFPFNLFYIELSDLNDNIIDTRITELPYDGLNPNYSNPMFGLYVYFLRKTSTTSPLYFGAWLGSGRKNRRAKIYGMVV